MKIALPDNAKIAKEAKECMQECVSEFISFITSEGEIDLSSLRATRLSSQTIASEKCQQEKRKTVNGEDILFAMTSLGFENYGEALKIYLSRYREVRHFDEVTSYLIKISTVHSRLVSLHFPMLDFDALDRDFRTFVGSAYANCLLNPLQCSN